MKWVDLSYRDCTWEEADVIADDEMIHAYQQRQQVPAWKLQPPKSRAERIALGESSILHFKDNKVSDGAGLRIVAPTLPVGGVSLAEGQLHPREKLDSGGRDGSGEDGAGDQPDGARDPQVSFPRGC